jgi:MerR family copper efflux transcriptional regulator
MNIGTAAKRSGVPAKTIRYYESIGLIPQAGRAENGYRSYGQREVDILRFIHHARQLGFAVKDVAALLALWQDRDRASADVKALALRHIAEVEQRIAELQALRRTLVDLTERCHGDHRPDCPIIEELAEAATLTEA